MRFCKTQNCRGAIEGPIYQRTFVREEEITGSRFTLVHAAIAREKQIKEWARTTKMAVIE
jgi:predicted GIY-YIG superfamily endonuclease